MQRRRLILLGLLGFSSGLPMLLTGQTLQAWLTDAKLDVVQIGQFAAIGLPYTFKFAWAPLLDRFAIPILGRRRGWILVFQLALIVALGILAMLDPRGDPIGFALAALVVATLSASQDIAIDAYNADLLSPEERAAGSASYVMGYRVALLAAGSLALVIADHVAWHAIYLGMAGLMLVGVVATLLAEEPTVEVAPPRTLGHAVIEPVRQLVARFGLRHALLLLAFAATYKFGEQFVQGLLVTFFRETGFSNTEVGLVTKGVGFGAWAIGGATGGILVARYGVRRVLVPFAILQAITHAAYLLVALAGKDLVVFGAAIFVENATYAMATSAFVAALMGACSPAVSATQFALLTSLSSVGQRVFGAFAGGVVTAIGWPGFFTLAIGLSLPGLAIAWFVGRYDENTAR